MTPEPDLSRVAGLIGDPSRAAILTALLGGEALPASELAYRARIAPATASAHLMRLVEGGLLAVTTSGRHRYYRIASADVARVLEALAVISAPPKVRDRRASEEMEVLRAARTCYDHLAGQLGVAIAQALLDRGLLAQDGDEYRLTEAGSVWLAQLGVTEADLKRGRRKLAHPCIDWSERRDHVGGVVGAALAARLLALGWVERVPHSRAVRLTDIGREGLKRELALELSA